MNEREVKQVIVIRRDLGMRRGKEIAQGAHASMAWLSNRLEENRHYSSDDLEGGGAWLEGEVTKAELQWLNGAFTKVVCQVPDEDALLQVFDNAEHAGVLAHVIQDAGRTEFGGVPTKTAVAVGPDWADVVDLVTGKLELY